LTNGDRNSKLKTKFVPVKPLKDEGVLVIYVQKRTLVNTMKITSEQATLEKIKEMLKADKFSDTIVLKLGNDMPLNLSLKMISDEGELSFLLAPRIESEE
jgi:hypothetical protein